MSAPALTLRGIHKRFGNTVALDGAECAVRAGTVHALLGENGAGKTTLMRIAFGMLQPDAGELLLHGRPYHPQDSRAAIAAGVGMVHQHFMLVPALTVAENAALGGHGRFARADAAARVRAIGEATGLQLNPDARVADLPVGAQQRAEIVRALSHDARVLILDEPTAVLTPSESDELYAWMRRFAAQGGTAVLITHKLREALAVADDVTVLRRGRSVLQQRRGEVTEPALVQAIIGTGVDARAEQPLPTAPDGDVVLALDAAGWTDGRGVTRLAPTTLQVRRGEILGVLGVEGAGQAELLRLLAGRLAPSTGNVQRPERVGFIPEDRLQDAIIPAFTLTENLALAVAGTAEGLMPWTELRDTTSALVEEYDVRAPGPSALAAALSGGNQQRFVVGRERARAEGALVAENPTRGLDVRAAQRVLDAIRSVATVARGAAVVHSADLDEILALTRRIAVCFNGQVHEVPPPADPNDREPYARALVGAFD